MRELLSLRLLARPTVLIGLIIVTVLLICALGAHVRVRDPGIAGAVSFLVLAVAALIAGLGYHHHL